MSLPLAKQLSAQVDQTVGRSCKPRRAPRREGQPMYTEARGRHWEIWIKVAPKGKRRRVRTWIPVKRHPVTGAPLNGELALSVYNTVARLWECPHPRWYVLQATADEGEHGALQRLHDAVVESGLAGADVLAASLEDRAQTASGHVDLVPLVEEWEVSAPTRQRGKGSISATTRLLMVSRVLKLFSPDLLAWRTTRSLAIRDDRPIPPKPNVTPFLLADFTWAKIHEHLAKSYRAKPTVEQREALAHKDPIRRELTEAALQGQGAGALAAFNAFAVFARWLVASGVIAVDPTEGKPRPADSPPDLAYLDNHEDIERIATRLVAPLDDIWRVMCGTGIEPSPALVLEVEKVEVLATPVLHAHGTKSPSRKRNAEYGDRTAQAVERARTDAVRNGRPTLFPTLDERGAGSRDTVSRRTFDARATPWSPTTLSLPGSTCTARGTLSR